MIGIMLFGSEVSIPVVPIFVAPLIPLLLTLLFKQKRTFVSIFLMAFLGLLIVSMFVPAIFVAEEFRYYSVFQFALSGQVPFIIMFISYIVAFLLLLKANPNLDFFSLLIFFVGYISSWFGLMSDKFPNIISTSDDLQLAFIVLYYVFGAVPLILYTSLSLIPNSDKKRVRFVKFLDDLGSNRPLLRGVAMRYGWRDLNDGSGWKQASLTGDFDNHTIQFETTMVRVTNVPVSIQTIKFVLRKSNLLHPVIVYLRNPGKDYLGDYATLPESRVKNGFKIRVRSNVGEVRNRLELLVPGLIRVLSKDKYSSPPWLELGKGYISYHKHSMFNYNPHLSVEDVGLILSLLAKISRVL